MARSTEKPTTAPPVVALVGSDAFLHTQRLAEVLRELPPNPQRIDVDGERAELAAVLDELRSFALFGGGAKLVVVRQADAFLSRFREQLEAYVASPSQSGTLVLRLQSLPSTQRIYKAITKVGRIVPCEPPKARELPGWIAKQAGVHHAKIDPGAAELLADLVGGDLGRLDNELAKLALQADDNRITVQTVSTGVAFQRERQMWDMTNALAAGDTAEALHKWRQLVQGDSSAEFRAVAWLGIWLENVRKALAMKRRGLPQQAIVGALKIWPRDMVGPFFQTAESMGHAGVARAIDLLAEIDLQSKSGVGDAAENVERFMLTLAV